LTTISLFYVINSWCYQIYIDKYYDFYQHKINNQSHALRKENMPCNFKRIGGSTLGLQKKNCVTLKNIFLM